MSNESADAIAAYGTPKAAARQGRLGYLPIALFGSVLGLVGLSSAWHHASQVFAVPDWISQAIGLLAVLAFVAVAVGYAVKIITAAEAARAEYLHPVAGNLFGTFFISLLLLPIPLAPYSVTLARALWLAGTVGMVVFAWLIMSRWLGQRQQAAHATPAWIVPVVGLIDIPQARTARLRPHLHHAAGFEEVHRNERLGHRAADCQQPVVAQHQESPRAQIAHETRLLAGVQRHAFVVVVRQRGQDEHRMLRQR